MSTPREILAVDYLEERVEILGRALLDLDVRSEEYEATILEIDRILGILRIGEEMHVRVLRDGANA